MRKFDRKFKVTISFEKLIDPKTIEIVDLLIIEPPFTLDLNIVRNTMSSSNNATFQIHNLSSRTRQLIFQDRFKVQTNVGDIFKRIIVEAGYGETLFQIFSGTIFEASSKLSGSDIITSITSRDGYLDFANTTVNTTFESGITLKSIISKLIGEFPFIKEGTVSVDDHTFQRPVVADGSVWDMITGKTRTPEADQSRQDTYVDSGKFNILRKNECLLPQFLINDDTGLLETPQRQDAVLIVTLLFEPQIGVGQCVKLESNISPIYNGNYKAIGVAHQGVISEAVGGTLITKVNLLLTENLLGGIQVA